MLYLPASTQDAAPLNAIITPSFLFVSIITPSGEQWMAHPSPQSVSLPSRLTGVFPLSCSGTGSKVSTYDWVITATGDKQHNSIFSFYTCTLCVSSSILHIIACSTLCLCSEAEIKAADLTTSATRPLVPSNTASSIMSPRRSILQAMTTLGTITQSSGKV